MTEEIKKENRVVADTALFWAGLFFLLITGAEYLIRMNGLFGIEYTDGVRFVLELIKGTSAAALIGGLADWYGVTSIFGKPFHIPYKTEILRNRKDSFIQSIRDFIGNELLSEQNIQYGLKRLDIADRVLERVLAEKGKDTGLVKLGSEFISKLVFGMLANVESEKVIRYIKKLLVEQLEREKPSVILLRLLKVLLEHPKLDWALAKIAEELNSLLELRSTKDLIDRAVDMAVENYREKAKRRGIVADALGEKLKRGIYHGIEEHLQKLKKLDEVELLRWRSILGEFFEDFERNTVLLDRIDVEVYRFIEENEGIRQRLQGFLESFKNEEETPKKNLERVLESGINHILELLLTEHEWIERAESTLSSYLLKLLNEKREDMKELVEKNLQQMPEKELLLFLRENTENELQIIRLNGMFFGTAIGFIVTLLKLFVGIK